MLPDFGDPVDGGDGAGGAHQRFVTEEAAQDPGARGQEDVQHRDDDHHGDEVRHVGDGLHEALDLLRADLVDEQGQNDREDEAHDQRPQGDADGVGHDLAEERVMEELVEIFESYELAAGQTLGRVEFAEGKLDAPHRHVGEQADEEQGGSGEDPQLPVAAEVVGDAIEQTWFLAVGSRFHRHGPCSNALRCLCTHVGLQFRMIAREQKCGVRRQSRERNEPVRWTPRYYLATWCTCRTTSAKS